MLFADKFLVFVLNFSNHIYQIGLPMPHQDCPAGKADYQIRYWPHPWDTPEHIAKYGWPSLSQEDLTSPEKKRDDLYTVRMSFTDSEEIHPQSES